MQPARPSSDPLLLGIAVVATLLAVGMVADRPASVDVFQSPPPVSSYAKTVDKTQAQGNDLLTYNIIITNTGGPTTDTLVGDSLPPQAAWLGPVTASYGTAAYAPYTRRIGWVGSLQPASTLVISCSVVITDVPPYPGHPCPDSLSRLASRPAGNGSMICHLSLLTRHALRE